jgi:hypothetical protein
VLSTYWITCPEAVAVVRAQVAIRNFKYLNIFIPWKELIVGSYDKSNRTAACFFAVLGFKPEPHGL